MTSLDNLLVGQSGPMRETKRLIELAAPSTTTLLIQGETGTGKELVAQATKACSAGDGLGCRHLVAACSLLDECLVDIQTPLCNG